MHETFLYMRIYLLDVLLTEVTFEMIALVSQQGISSDHMCSI